MFRIPSYLLLSRHHIYYFRVAVPLRLRAVFDGRQEIRIPFALPIAERRLHALHRYHATHARFLTRSTASTNRRWGANRPWIGNS